MRIVTLRCRFSVQCGKYEKHVYECTINAQINPRELELAYAGRDNVVGQILDGAARRLLDTLPEATVHDESLKLALMNGASEVIRREEMDR